MSLGEGNLLGQLKGCLLTCAVMKAKLCITLYLLGII